MADILKRAAVLGASGYTGAEAVRLIVGHPRLELVALTGHSRAGESYSDIYPSMSHLDLPDVVKADEVDWDAVDVVFACLPHGASQDTIATIADRVETVIDLSADFRLRDAELYAKTYDRSHDHPNLLKGAVYGLTEYARADLLGAKLVACPGCYPTCSLLALLPAIDNGLIDLSRIIIDAKSGVTGAGRKALQAFAYSEISDGAHAYAVGKHRHAPEIDQILNRLAPQTRHIRASNHCRIGVFADRAAGRAIIISVIDNLTKGSSGQAVQNYNAVQGWDEGLGLSGQPVFP